MDSIDVTKIEESDAPKMVVEVYRELKRFKSDSEREKWAKRDRDAEKAVVENEIWDDAEKTEMKDTGQIPLVINLVNKGVQGRAAIVTANNPEIKVYPEREADPFVAELLKGGIDFVWAKNSGNDVVYDVERRKNIGGIGFFNGFIEASKGMFGRIVIEENDPMIWHWDAESKKRDLSDSHLIKAQLRTKKYIRDHYEGIKDEDLVFERMVDISSDDGDKTDSLTGGDNYIHDTKTPGETDAEKDKKEIWEIEAWWLKTEKEDWVILMREGDRTPTVARLELQPGQKPDDVIQDYIARAAEKGEVFTMADHWPRKMQNRYLRIIVGKKVIKQTEDDKTEVEERKNPYGLDSDGDPVLPAIPLMADRGRKSYPYAPTFYALPINKSLCKREAQFIYTVSKTLNSPIVRDANSKWSGQPDKPGSELITGANLPYQPYRLGPGQVDLSGLAMRIEEDKGNIRDQYDIPEILTGKVQKGQENMSGRLGLALQDAASMMQNPGFKWLESSMIRLAKLILAMMLKTWPRYMWERLLPEEDKGKRYPDGVEPPQDIQPGTDAALEEEEKLRAKWEAAIEKIEKGGVDLIDLDIRLTAGSSLPTNRMAKEQVSMEKYKVGLYDRRAALEYSNDPKAKEISDRMDAKEEAMMQAGAVKK